jgi:hypothetical protein
VGLWVCVFALAYQYLFVPFASWGFAAAHMTLPPLPRLDDNLWQLLTGLPGLGMLRAFDKLKGLSK